MICPYCETTNRDERDTCYHCDKDLKMLRLLVNKAKHHYNIALEHAERGRRDEAIVELRNALSYDSSNAQAHVLLGTMFAQQEKFDEARDEWDRALKLNPSLEKAHDYLEKAEVYSKSLPALRFYRLAAILLMVVVAALGAWVYTLKAPRPVATMMRSGMQAYSEGDWGEAHDAFQTVANSAGAGESTRSLAESMAAAVEGNVESLVEEIDREIQTGDYVEALRDARALTELGLHGEMGQIAEVASEQAPERIRNDLTQSIDFFRRSGAGFPRLQSRVRNVRRALEEGLLDEEEFGPLIEQANQARQTVSENELALIRIEWLQNENDEAALVQIFSMIQGFGEDVQDEAREFYETLLNNVADPLEKEVNARIAAGDYDAAREAIDARLKFFPRPLKEEVLAAIGPVDEMIESRRAGEFWEQALNLFEADDRPEFIALVGQAENYPGLSATRRADLQSTATLFLSGMADDFLDRVESKRQAEDWDALLELSADIENYTLTEEQTETLEEWFEDARDARGQGFVDEIEALAEDEQWTSLLNRLEGASLEVMSEGQKQRVEELRGTARETLADTAVEEVRGLMDEDELNRALERARELRTLDLPEEQLDSLDELIGEIRTRRSEALLDELFNSLDPRFSNVPGSGVPEDVARQVVEDFDTLLEAVPERATYRVRQLKFYRAASHVILGENEMAQQRFEEFLDEYSGDYTSAARRYLDVVNERLEESQSTEEES